MVTRLFVITFTGLALATLYGAQRAQARKDRDLRKELTDRQIDRMIENSYPASDPPSTY